MRIRSLTPALSLIASAALVMAACGTTEPTVSAAPSVAAFQPSYSEVECPDDVEVALLVEHACGRLSVLEDRTKPAGRTISVFVVRMDPPGEASADPMLAIGGDIGDAPGFGGIAPLPGRVHRVLYVMVPRGVGSLRAEPRVSRVR